MSVLLGMAGCVTYAEKRKMEAPLALAGAFMSGGDFQAALKENDKVFRNPSEILRDRALFQRGLIYSHPQNPNQNYQKSIEYFQKLLEEYPDSGLKNAAEVWILSLHQIVRMRDEFVSLSGKIGLMDTTIKEQRRTINQFQEELRKQQANTVKQKILIDELKDQIETLKNIDLRIEKKKRKAVQQ
jgi:tetratricopeptide (TPR) repeat protein